MSRGMTAVEAGQDGYVLMPGLTLTLLSLASNPWCELPSPPLCEGLIKGECNGVAPAGKVTAGVGPRDPGACVRASVCVQVQVCVCEAVSPLPPTTAPPVMPMVPSPLVVYPQPKPLCPLNPPQP